MKKISITKVDVETTLKQRNLVLSDYALQEDLLRDTFDKYKHNDDYGQILTKVTLLNLLYSTGIMDVKGVADHIFKHGKDIDSLMKKGDPTVVHLIAKVEHNGKPINHFSFATKYCSHHQPEKFAIYDSYVEKVLVTMNKREPFANFKKEGLKDYDTYMSVILSFRQHFGLTQYSIKQLDQYLWQLGKWYFNSYGLRYKYYNREDKSPFSEDDIRHKFWNGEMMFVTEHQSAGFWKEQSRKCLQGTNERIRQFAGKFTPEQFGVIFYIHELYAKWCPYDDLEWIFEY